MLFGTSTSVLSVKLDLESLLQLKPEVIEFYNYPSSALPRIHYFCKQHRIRIALHAPTPYDLAVPLRRFAPTGPDAEEVRQALELALATVRCAANLEAVHAVVHFPSPYPQTSPILPEESITCFLDPLMKEAEELSVRVLIENISTNASFYTPWDYKTLADSYPALGFCLDFGHANQLSDTALLEFVRVLGTRIYSCHVYNQRSKDGRRHVAVRADQSPSDGWIDLEAAARHLVLNSKIATWIMEPDPQPHDEFHVLAEGMQWFRDLIMRVSSTT